MEGPHGALDACVCTCVTNEMSQSVTDDGALGANHTGGGTSWGGRHADDWQQQHQQTACTLKAVKHLKPAAPMLRISPPSACSAILLAVTWILDCGHALFVVLTSHVVSLKRWHGDGFASHPNLWHQIQMLLQKTYRHYFYLFKWNSWYELLSSETHIGFIRTLCVDQHTSECKTRPPPPPGSDPSR